MSMKRKERPPLDGKEIFISSPLHEGPADWRKRLAGSSGEEEKIALMREAAGTGDVRAVPELLEIHVSSASERLSEEAREAILEIGVPAAGRLARISQSTGSGYLKRCIDELICDIKINDARRRADERDPSLVQELVEAIAAKSTPDRYADEASRVLTERYGLDAVRPLTDIASGSPEHDLQSASICVLSDIAKAYPGSEELLASVPMLVARISGLRDIHVDAETSAKIASWSEDSPKALLLLRAAHPEIWPVSGALELLGQLWEQNPGKEELSDAVFTLLDKIDTKEPVLNDLLRKTIREIGGFDPPLSKSPKGDKYEN